VLKKDGIMVRVIPLENHLFELKAAVYDKPYLNDVPSTDIDGFELVKTERIFGTLDITSNEDLQNLFKMTPYYYKTSKDDQAKLNEIDSLCIKAEFEIRVYRKD
jgi:23S rRNA (guanine745-N1)-methyltransferase